MEGMQADKEKQSGDEEANTTSISRTRPKTPSAWQRKIALAMIAAGPCEQGRVSRQCGCLYRRARRA